MTVTAVQLQTVTGVGAVSDRMLERKHQEPVRTQGSRERRNDTLQVAEIHQRVGRHDQVEGFAVVAQVLASTRLSSGRGRHSFPSRVPACLRTGPRRPAGAQKAPRARRTVPFHTLRPARRGAWEGLRPQSSSMAATSAGARYDSLASFASKLAAKLSKVVSTKAFDARSGTSRPVQAANMCRAIGFPGSSSSHSSRILVASTDLAQRAVRQRQQLARFGVLRPERDHLAVARRGFLGPLQPVEQNAEVGVCVDVLGIQPDGCAIRGFRFDRLSGCPQQYAEIVVGIRVARIDGYRAPIRTDCGSPACRSIARRCRDCCASPLDPARARRFVR